MNMKPTLLVSALAAATLLTVGCEQYCQPACRSDDDGEDRSQDQPGG